MSKAKKYGILGVAGSIIAGAIAVPVICAAVKNKKNNQKNNEKTPSDEEQKALIQQQQDVIDKQNQLKEEQEKLAKQIKENEELRKQQEEEKERLEKEKEKLLQKEKEARDQEEKEKLEKEKEELEKKEVELRIKREREEAEKRRLEEENRKKQEEQKRLEEEKRRIAEEQRRIAEENRKKEEERKKKEEEEKRRIAEENRKKEEERKKNEIYKQKEDWGNRFINVKNISLTFREFIKFCGNMFDEYEKKFGVRLLPFNSKLIKELVLAVDQYKTCDEFRNIKKYVSGQGCQNEKYNFSVYEYVNSFIGDPIFKFCVRAVNDETKCITFFLTEGHNGYCTLGDDYYGSRQEFNLKISDNCKYNDKWFDPNDWP